MPVIASGVLKQLRYKAESTFGVAPGASAAQLLRRVSSSLDLSKDTYKSAELRPDLQINDFRHGVRRVTGNIKGELSAGTYKDFFAQALRRDFVAGVTISGASITIAGAGPTYTVTRAAGSYISDGFKIGDVIRLSVGAFNAANLSKNLMIIALTATIATVIVLNGSVLVAEGPIATSTVTVAGKKTYAPQTGHTDKSFSIEHWFSDITQSELFTGCKVNNMDIQLPPTGLSTLDMAFIGQNITTATAQYFTSPTAATGTTAEAAVNGVLVAGGSQIAICTGLNFKINGGYADDAVVGSNQVAAIFPGRIEIDGQFAAYFQDNVLRDYFVNETEISLMVALTADGTAAADFQSFIFPRIKLGAANKSDGEQGVIVTFPFQALFNNAGGAATTSEQSTLVTQDTQA